MEEFENMLEHVCGFCNKIFKKETKLDRHIVKQHLNEVNKGKDSEETFGMEENTETSLGEEVIDKEIEQLEEEINNEIKQMGEGSHGEDIAAKDNDTQGDVKKESDIVGEVKLEVKNDSYEIHPTMTNIKVRKLPKSTKIFTYFILSTVSGYVLLVE